MDSVAHKDLKLILFADCFVGKGLSGLHHLEFKNLELRVKVYSLLCSGSTLILSKA